LDKILSRLEKIILVPFGMAVLLLSLHVFIENLSIIFDFDSRGFYHDLEHFCRSFGLEIHYLYLFVRWSLVLFVFAESLLLSVKIFFLKEGKEFWQKVLFVKLMAISGVIYSFYLYEYYPKNVSSGDVGWSIASGKCLLFFWVSLPLFLIICFYESVKQKNAAN
jgi:hypothetical protein